MKSILMVLRKLITRNIVIYILTTLGLALLFGTVITTYWAVLDLDYTYYQDKLDRYGSQSGLILHVDKPDKLRGCQAISKYGAFNIVALANISDDIPIAIGMADQAALDIHRIRLLEGAYPQKQNEIAVEEWMLDVLKLPKSLPQTMTLTNTFLSDGGVAVTRQDSFKIVGVLNNYSREHLDIPNAKEGQEQLPAILLGKQSNPSLFVHLTIQSEEEEIPYQVIDELFPEGAFFENESIRGTQWYGDENYVIDSIIVIALFLLAIICGAFLVIILLYTSHSVIDKRKPILWALGTGKAWLWSLSFLYSLSTLVPALFIGLLASQVLYYLLQYVMSNVFEITLQVQALASYDYLYVLWLLLGAVLLAIIVATTKLPRQKGVHSLPPKAKSNFKSPFTLIAYRSMMFNFRYFFLSSLAFSICIMMIAGGSVVENSLKHDIRNRIDCDYMIGSESYLSTYLLRIPILDDELSEDAYSLIGDTAVASYLLTRTIDVNIINESSSQALLELFGISRLASSYNTQEENLAYEKALEKYGYPIDVDLYRVNLLVIEDDAFAQLLRLPMQGNCLLEESLKGSEIVALVRAENETLNELLGTPLQFTQIFDYDDSLDLGRRVDFKSILSGIITVSPQAGLFTEAIPKGDSITFALPYSAVQTFYDNITFQRLYLQLYDANAPGSMPYKIERYRNENPNSPVTSKVEINAEIQKTRNIYLMVSTILIVFLSIVTLASVALHYARRLQERIGPLRRLYRMGATKEQLQLCLIYEYLAYVLVAAVLAIPLTLIFSYAIGDYSRDFVFIDIVIRYLLALSCLIFLGLFFAIYNKRWIKKNITTENHGGMS